MANSSLGTKFVCFQCATKFYDLNRPQAVCPKCSADQSLAPAKQEERGRARAAQRRIEEDEDLDTPLDDEDVPVLEEGFSSDDDELEAEEY